jgi:hypothetical protein
VPWEESSHFVVPGNHGSSTWAIWDIAETALGAQLASTWNETIDLMVMNTWPWTLYTSHV